MVVITLAKWELIVRRLLSIHEDASDNEIALGLALHPATRTRAMPSAGLPAEGKHQTARRGGDQRRKP
jgi:hypothetical protein